MQNVTQFPEDEAPTRPSDPIPSRILALASRIDRLAELAQERLLFSPDDQAVSQAVTELASIRHLCQQVGR